MSFLFQNFIYFYNKLLILFIINRPWLPGLRAVEFSTVKLLFLPFAYCTLWEKVTMCSPCWADTKIMLHAEQTQKLFGIMLHGRFVSLTYLLDHSFISAWIHGYLFYTLGYKPIWLFFFLHKLVQLWPLGTLSMGSCVPLWSQIIVFLFDVDLGFCF